MFSQLWRLLFPADRPIGCRELWSRRQDLHPLQGLPVARHRQERSPLRVQQREGGRQGDPSHSMGDEEATHEWRLKYIFTYIRASIGCA